jgi:tetratricopeptide (TPR) repeat protein
MELKVKNDIILLRKSAIKEASNQNWERAKQINLAILNQQKNNIETLNRLGIAYIKLGQKQNAVKCFTHVIKISPNNIISQKNLQKLHLAGDKKISNTIDKKYLVNDSSKSINLKFELNKKISSLDKEIGAGDNLIIKQKEDSISIYKDKILLNVIKHTIAKRISKLIKLGNKYSCTVIGSNEKYIRVNIKEIFKSESTMNIISFPEYLKSNYEVLSLNQNINHIYDSNTEDSEK